jgi:hypothetical protein
VVAPKKHRATGVHPEDTAMPPALIVRPAPSEYSPMFAGYVERVPTGDVLTLLTRQIDETIALLNGLSETDAAFRYAPDKWSIKQMIGHVSDTERIMTYRALCFARGETTALPAFDENAYVREAKFDGRTLADLLAEFRAIRAATVPFFAALDPQELARTGTASGRPYTVRSLAYIIAGHERHHGAIFRERYLPRLRAD